MGCVCVCVCVYEKERDFWLFALISINNFSTFLYLEKKKLVTTFKVRHLENSLATFLNNIDISMLKAALRDNKSLLNMQVKCLLFIYFLHRFLLGIRKSGAWNLLGEITDIDFKFIYFWTFSELIVNLSLYCMFTV